MKRMRYYSVICGLLVLMLVSCRDDSIPVQARSFIDQYFPHSSVVLVENADEDGVKEYCVWLNDGTKIEFDMHGSWRRIGRNKTGVPAPLIPDAIKQYVKIHYPQDVVTKFSKKNYGYKLELSNDMDLRFNHQCQFLEEVD